MYGKCNNPFGHGHDYAVQLCVRGPVDAVSGCVVDLTVLDQLVQAEVLSAFGYRDLNGLDAFRDTVPTTENLAAEVSRRLDVAWGATFGADGPVLEMVRIWETPRNICEISYE